MSEQTLQNKGINCFYCQTDPKTVKQVSNYYEKLLPYAGTFVYFKYDSGRKTSFQLIDAGGKLVPISKNIVMNGGGAGSGSSDDIDLSKIDTIINVKSEKKSNGQEYQTLVIGSDLTADGSKIVIGSNKVSASEFKFKYNQDGSNKEVSLADLLKKQEGSSGGGTTPVTSDCTYTVNVVSD